MSSTSTIRQAPPSQHAAGAFEVAWARHADEVREAQRLRYDVFASEMGARLATPVALHDVDRFDEYCEHLLVRDCASREVIGTYRLLTPSQAGCIGATYCDGEFGLDPLSHLRPHMVELGRSCVHADHRHGGVILALWIELAKFMHRQQLDTMIGCASIPMRAAEGDATPEQVAAGVWHRLRRSHLAAPPFRVQPHRPLPVDGPFSADAVTPPLIRGYLSVGAKVLGPPAWDAQFNTADLPMMLRMADLPPRFFRAARSA